MSGKEDANIIDIKMGTSTITCNIKGNPKRLEKRLLKDMNTTTSKLGMKIIGYVIKSLERCISEKFYKFPYKSEKEIPLVFKKLFSFPNTDNKDEADEYDINREAQEYILKELYRLLDFIANRSNRDIKGASILILVDHFSRNYTVKMIDLSTIEVYADPS